MTIVRSFIHSHPASQSGPLPAFFYPRASGLRPSLCTIAQTFQPRGSATSLMLPSEGFINTLGKRKLFDTFLYEKRSFRPHLFKAEVDGETSSYEEREADASTREANAAVHEAKWMNEMEISIYDSWFNPIVSELPELVPDAFIYLEASRTPACRSRKRPEEVNVGLR
nr:uncharacterized protein LOC112281582 [Physcomitrium patens]|eukprot:XP_024374001.1 uncharacterized protein LOC112281582 [Physcomitrella patens]